MSSPATAFPLPQRGASLILSFRLQNKTILILGSGPLAASRAFAALEADSLVVVIAKGGLVQACDELKYRAQCEELTILDYNSLPGPSTASCSDIESLDSYLTSSNGITLVCVTDTILGADPTQRRTRAEAEKIYHLCRRHNIPVNITDMPDLCDFTFPSTHRFTLSSSPGEGTALQVGITTNGRGCRLAGRIRREVVARLPRDVGAAVENVGRLRDLVKENDAIALDEEMQDVEFNEDNGVPTPNRPVSSRSIMETEAESTKRRMKWVAQVSEYWPLTRLAAMTDEEMKGVLSNGDMLIKSPDTAYLQERLPGTQSDNSQEFRLDTLSQHSLVLPSSPSRGKIFLVGSGTGHPALLTLATHILLTRHAHLVLSDKLVPDAVLAVIPKSVEVRIARKFPGNAEGAQMELMKAAIEAARRGLTVVRLKQGDPVVYGRAGEEVLYFRAHGFEPLIVPGVSSALAAPTFAGIPVTQRGVAESFIVCTGVGRAGKEVKLPGYDRARTTLILMGVARLEQVLAALMTEGSVPGRDGAQYPPYTPIALVERASMPDQRVVESTLWNVRAAVESIGEQRPPGMLVIGWAVLSLWKEGDVSVLGEGAEDEDERRVETWLGDVRWRIKEGLQASWDDLSI